MNKYRFDSRSSAKFAKDIKEASLKEADVAVRLCIKVHAKTKKWPDLIPNGIDYSGSFIQNNSIINSNPDFKIGNREVEITMSDFPCNKFFHQKYNKVNNALKNKTDIVFVNGYKIKQPMFVWLVPELLEELTNKAMSKYGIVGHPGSYGSGDTLKKSFRYDLYWLKGLWVPLPNIYKGIPKEYLDILNSIKEVNHAKKRS